MGDGKIRTLNKTPRHKAEREKKRIADETEPVVVIPVVRKPVEVRLALGAVPPRIADLRLTGGGNV